VDAYNKKISVRKHEFYLHAHYHSVCHNYLKLSGV
jgi:hypothetical protein